MEDNNKNARVNIRPGVKVLSVLRHLNYRPWFALAEFVDNSIQSFIDHQAQLESVEKDFSLSVDIEIDPNSGRRITIRDNAAGIHEEDFPRAFRPAEVPVDTTGLCEFGMGMKSAACWFSPTWHVRTSALDEPVEKTVVFDISKIVQDEIEELDVDSVSINETVHFTEIVLSNLHRVPVGRTIGKIKEHLQDIYRIFVREGILTLRFNGEELIYEQPEILSAPYFKNENSEPLIWRKDIDFDFGEDLRVRGFAAIRKTASTTRAGFALFRRRRLIQGSGDEGYRPEFIFGKPNSFIYQRLFGELHLEGFEVSHTKDGFQWDENEEPFLELLKEELSKQDLPLLRQAREFRVQRKPQDFQKGAAATQHTSEAIKQHVPPILVSLTTESDDQSPPEGLRSVSCASRRVIDVELHGQPWRIIIELSVDPAVGDWLEISDQVAQEESSSSDNSCRIVGLRMSLVHPFMQRFGGIDSDEIEPLLRVAAALGLAEVAARDSGVRMAGTIRRNINELLRNALSQT